MRRIIFLLCFGLLISNAKAHGGFVLSGNIRTEQPIEISLKTLSGKLLGKDLVNSKKGAFSIAPGDISTDLYQITIGKTVEQIYLTNNPVSINGYYDAVDNKSTALDFTGIDAHLKIAAFLPEKLLDQKKVDPNTLTNLTGTELAALAKLFNNDKYVFNFDILQKIPAGNRDSEAAKWLIKQVDSLKMYSVGVPAPDFSLPNDQGKLISLKDLKGKITVLDFWASWCGPCRKAMQEFKTFYDDFKDNVQFVSISLDDDPAKYQQGLEDMEIPWMKLLDNRGFYKSDLNAKYGFKMIPYCVILDQNGMILARDIQSAGALKKALKELTKTK